MSHPAHSHAHERCNTASCEVCDMRHYTFCSVLEGKELSQLAAIVHREDIDQHRFLFQEGDAAHEVFNILDGTVKLYKSLPDGRTQITGFLFPGDFLGLSTKGDYSYSAEAITDVRVCRFQRRDLNVMFKDYPKLVDRLLGIASDELAAAQEQMLLLGRKTAQERILSFLHVMSERARRRGQPVSSLNLTMSRADIADYLGLTIETVSRTLTKLREKGIIKLPRPQEVVLAEGYDLAAAAEGDA